MRTLAIIWLCFIFMSTTEAQNTVNKLVELYGKGDFIQTISLCEAMIQKNETTFEIFYYKGLSEQALSKFKEATETFRQSLFMATDSIPVLFSLGNCQESAGDDEAAIKTYQQLLGIDSAYNPAKARLASIYKSQRDYSKAMEWYAQLVKSDTTNGYFYSQLAWCCSKFGLFEPVVPYYLKAIELNPNDLRSITELISELVDHKYYEDVQYYCDSFLVLFPGNLKILKQQAYVTALEGKTLDAVRQFRYITQLGDSSMFTCKYYGQSLYNNGQFPEAIFWLDKYLKNQPDDTKNQFIMGLACQKDYQYEKSLEHFDITLKQVFDPELIARIYTETGTTFSKFADYTSFRDSTKTKADPLNKKALENYLAAESIHPQGAEIYKTLGVYYKDKLKDAKIALYYLEKYRQKVNHQKLDEYELIWLDKEIGRLKEEVHFIGG